MSALNEIAFERLLPKYERIYGGPPPFTSATVDEVVAFMRARLQESGASGECRPDDIPVPPFLADASLAGARPGNRAS